MRRWITPTFGLAAAAFFLACDSEPTSVEEGCDPPRIGTLPGGLGHPARSGATSVSVAGTPFAVAVSPTGTAYVTLLHTASAVRADLPATTLSTPFPVGDLPSQVRISPDGQTAYVGNQDASTITSIDVATNDPIGTFTAANGSILTIGLAPDGGRLYALTDFYGVFVSDPQTGSVVGWIPPSSVGVLLTGVAFHPFAPCMYVAARDQGQVTTVDLRTDTVVRTYSVVGGRLQNVAVALDGSALYATDIERSKLIVWDLQSGSSTFQERDIGSAVVRNAFDVAVTPDNTQLYVTTLADGVVYVLDRAAGTPLGSIVTGGSPRYIGFSADGSHAVIANEGGSVHFVQ